MQSFAKAFRIGEEKEEEIAKCDRDDCLEYSILEVRTFLNLQNGLQCG